jgi:hydroxyacylglutathione hydrolase
MERKKPDMLAQGVRWFDDWFAIESIASGIHAIGEPLYHWFNWSYLIEGKDRALLFDTGPGLHNIAPVVDSLTVKPLVVLPSHMHFDHTGNLHQFPHIAMADLPVLRAYERDGMFHASDDLFIGRDEGLVWKLVRVTTWWPIGHHIDLGGRELEIIHTPGHSPDSISLFDVRANILFAADFIYPGDLYAQVPGSDLREYLSSSDRLLTLINDKTKIFCCHGKPDDAGQHRAPLMGRRDILDLSAALNNLRFSGNRPDETQINARMTLLANEAAYASWQAT